MAAPATFFASAAGSSASASASVSTLFETGAASSSSSDSSCNGGRFAPDVHIITDATSSMGTFLTSLKVSVVQIASLLRVLSPETRLGMRAYRDMCDRVITENIPMRSVADKGNYAALLQFAEQVVPSGGGDTPEAAKRGLYESLINQDVGKGTIVLLYADAPPHHGCNGGNTKDSNGELEKAWFVGHANGNANANGKKGSVRMWDWVHLAKAYQAVGARVFCFIGCMDACTHNFYTILSTITGGQCFRFANNPPSSATITEATMHTLMTILGCGGGDGNLASGPPGVQALGYPSVVQSLLGYRGSALSTENDSAGFLRAYPTHRATVQSKVPLISVGKIDLKELPRRFKTDAAFRDVVFEVLSLLLTDEHVMSLTTNAVFGTLWRSVCCWREDPRRDALTDVMGKVVVSPRLETADREKLGVWLANSYDQSEEIAELLTQVATERGAYPALMLSLPAQTESTPSMSASASSAASSVAAAEPMVVDESDTVVVVAGFSTAKELLEIARACDAKTMARITSLLTHLTLVSPLEESVNHNNNNSSTKTAPTTSAMARLPLALSDRDLFELLPHLMCPGTRFSLRPAIIIAALAYLADIKLLKVQAARFLQASKGKWFDKEQQENFSYGFVRLMNRLPEGLALTVEEAKLFVDLKLVAGFASNMQSSFTAVTGYKPCHTDARIPDYRITCVRCKMDRSFTLMVREKTGILRRLWSKEEEEVICTTCYHQAHPSRQPYIATVEDQRQVAEDGQKDLHGSHLTECRACHTLYAVVRTHALNVTPKCHACRFDKGVGSRITCIACRNTFADPAALFADQAATFHCGACSSAKKPVLKDYTATFQDLAATVTDLTMQRDLGVSWKTTDANKRHLVLLGQVHKLLTLAELLEVLPNVPCADLCSSASSSSSTSASAAAAATPVDTLVLDGGNCATLEPTSSSAASSTTPLWTYVGKPMLNTREIVDEINARIRSGEGQVETCYLCCQDLPCSAMSPSCGSCSTRSCTKCLAAWYGSLKPGELVLPAHLTCPFCKAAPKPFLLAKFNQEACSIRKAVTGPSGTNKLHMDFYHAWCVTCYRVKPLVERRCTDGEVPRVTAFDCTDCREERVTRAARTMQETEAAAMLDPTLMGKPCPTCKAQTSKAGGCSHMECPSPCNTHWCYQCGDAFDAAIIYKHMNQEHGNIGYEWTE